MNHEWCRVCSHTTPKSFIPDVQSLYLVSILRRFRRKAQRWAYSEAVHRQLHMHGLIEVKTLCIFIYRVP